MSEQIERTGPGLHLRAGELTTDQLVRIAKTATASGLRVTFSGLERRGLSELVRIAGAGGRWAGRSDRPSAGFEPECSSEQAA